MLIFILTQILISKFVLGQNATSTKMLLIIQKNFEKCILDRIYLTDSRRLFIRKLCVTYPLLCFLKKRLKRIDRFLQKLRMGKVSIVSSKSYGNYAMSLMYGMKHT